MQNTAWSVLPVSRIKSGQSFKFPDQAISAALKSPHNQGIGYAFIHGDTMSAIQLYKEHPETYERQIVGTITEKQLDFLMENLEEEFEEDEEYYLSADTIDYLKEQGADKDLVAILEKALSGAQDGVDIFYLIK
jgi:hypothetical protein